MPYTYIFTCSYSYDHPPYESVNWGMPISHSYLGAFHGAEVPFVFYDDFELAGSELKLSAAMAQYWTTFAATGNPNPGLTQQQEQQQQQQRDGDGDGDGDGEGDGNAQTSAANADDSGARHHHRQLQGLTCDQLHDCGLCAEYGEKAGGCVWCPAIQRCEAYATRSPVRDLVLTY